MVKTLLFLGSTLKDGAAIATAVESDNIKMVRMLVSAGAKPTLNSLNMAVMKQNEDHAAFDEKLTAWVSIVLQQLVKFLLKHKAATDTSTLVVALKSGCATIVRQLLAVKCKGYKSPKMLREAVKTRDAMMVHLILEAGCEMDPKGLVNSVLNNDVEILKGPPHESTPVCHITWERKGCISLDHPYVCALLFRNVRASYREHHAVQMLPRDEYAVVLLRYKADPNLAMHTAIHTSNDRVIHMLIDKGADHRHALKLAVEQKDVFLVRELCERNKPDESTVDTLEYSIRKDMFAMVSVLLSKGCAIPPERELLKLAISRGHFDMVKILLEHNAKPDSNALQVTTPLAQPIPVPTE
eukprot:471509-Pyramimonas_sp.AAC.2